MTWEDLNNLIFGIMFILIGKFGDYIETHPRHYSCPSYCDIDHTHIIPEVKNDSRYIEPVIQDSDSLYIIADSK
jgi:hypothetical protein